MKRYYFISSVNTFHVFSDLGIALNSLSYFEVHLTFF